MCTKSAKKQNVNGLTFNSALPLGLAVMLILSVFANRSTAIGLLPLHQGDFWEYQWDYLMNSSSQGSGGSTKTDEGRFWVFLGAPKQINGVTAYQVQVFGKSHVKGEAENQGVTYFAPRWSYLAVANNKLLGSQDGATLVTLFDGNANSWAGGGFFTSVPADKLVMAQSGTIQNAYISESAIKVERSAHKDQCETIGGYVFCGDDSYNWQAVEYYLALGPIGYKYTNSYMDCGGNFCSGASWTINVGMVASSLMGNTLTLQPETEPDNTPRQAQAIAMPVIISGNAAVGTGYQLITDIIWNGQYYKPEPTDWFRFSLASPTQITILLSFEKFPGKDLDLFLVQDTCTYFQGALICSDPLYPVKAYSVKDNIATGDLSESITTTLNAGKYIIAVDAFDVPRGVTIQYDLYASGPRVIVPPSFPTDVEASDGTFTDHIQVTWDYVSGATGFEVLRNTSDSSGLATNLGVKTSPFDDYGVTTDGTLYWYWVQAKNSSGTSVPSASDSGYAINPPCKFGSFDGQKNIKLTLLDCSGNDVTFSLTGGGYGAINCDDCSFSTITLSGTTDKSILSIKTKGNVGTGVGDIICSGPLKGISAKTIDLDGNIEIGSSLNPKANVTIAIDQAEDLTINSGIPIKTLTVTEWVGGSINAPSIGSITTKGDKKRSITGDLDVDVTSGTIQSIKTAGTLSGDWTCDYIKSISATHIVETNLTLNQPPDVKIMALGKLTVKGWIGSSQILSQGNIGTVTAGKMVDSSCFAGVADGVSGLPDPAVNINYSEPATIKSISVKGIKGELPPYFSNSNISAANILSAYLSYPENDNGGIHFGLSAGFIKSLKIKDAQGTQPYKILDKPADDPVLFGDLKILLN